MRSKGSVVLALVFCAFAVCAGENSAAAAARVVPSARFILQLGVLVFAAKMGGRLFDRWHLPKVLGELLAGLLVGPHLLGGLALPLFPEGLMRDADGLLASQGPVYGVMMLSLVVLFFLIGMDTDLRQLRRSPSGGVAAGAGGFLSGFAVSLMLLVWLAPALTGKSASWGWASPQALLISTVVSVTSVGVLARILAARQRLESPAGTVALAAAMTDNVLGLFLFTVFSASAEAVANGAQPTGLLLLSMMLRTLLGCGLVALCGFPIARHMNALALREKSYTGAFVVSAACLLIAGGVMGVLGLSVMAGAYVMGIAFSATDLRHEIRERLDFVNVVLVPACFAVVGMQIDPNLLADTSVVLAAVMLAAGAAVAKLAGGALSAGMAELNAVGCLRVGVVSLPRGELSLAMLAAVIGMAALPSGVFFGVVLLVVVSCVSATFLSDRAFAWGGNGTRAKFVMPDPVKLIFQLPSHQAAMLMVNRAVAIFEDDGFYAHLLNRNQVLYRISRESQVIHLHSREGEVVFECSENERPLINTVMLELSSGVEQNLRELQKPLDDVALRKNMQSAAPASASAVAAGMLRNRFAIETLKPRLLATTKQGAISELVSLLYENGLVMDRERAVQAVFEREQSLSTGLEYGLAIPHARTDAVTRLVCAVGLKKEGLDFDAVDGKPARIVALVLAPDSAATPQLQLIAQLCRMLNEQGRAALLACETSEDMFGVLAVGAGSPSTPAHGKRPSPLPACLQWHSMSLEMSPADQTQALSLLLALCARSGAVGAVEEVRKEIQARPALMAEKIGDEVAVFAIETQNVYRTVAALGVSAQGVACSGSRCRVCVMVLYPASAAADAARVKEALAHALDAKGVAALLAAKTSKEALDGLLKA
jgi:Kef-type K+ transport system membrane component KefB/mannitol/fructose-specific phosphotransferase system IIA component (Ntr-type)